MKKIPKNAVRIALLPIIAASSLEQPTTPSEPLAPAPTSSVPIGRARYTADQDVWKRLRCECGHVLVITKKTVREKIAALTGPCDYFKFTCGGCKVFEFAFIPRGCEAEALARKLSRAKR